MILDLILPSLGKYFQNTEDKKICIHPLPPPTICNFQDTSAMLMKLIQINSREVKGYEILLDLLTGSHDFSDLASL